MLQFASEPTMSMSCWFLKLALWSQIVFQHKSHLDGKADAAICFRTHNEYELLLFPSFLLFCTNWARESADICSSSLYSLCEIPHWHCEAKKYHIVSKKLFQITLVNLLISGNPRPNPNRHWDDLYSDTWSQALSTQASSCLSTHSLHKILYSRWENRRSNEFIY